MKKFAFALTLTSGAAAVLTHQDAQASTQHAVQSGESLWTVAAQYGTTVDAIKQANGLTNNMIFPGQVLSIGGGSATTQNATQYNVSTTNVSGGGHTVIAGESLDLIAAQYGVSVQDLMNANGLNGYLIHPNQTLQIPGQSSYTTTNVNTAAAGGATGVTQVSNGYNSPTFNHQNLYDWGQCTWHAFNRRAETGQPISTYWWNADHWAGAAAADGYVVNNSPQAGAIMQSYEGPVGHVAYVERVNPDGSVLVSEMNYNTPPGQVGYRTVPGSLTSSYNYIH
ncbi:peptidase M23B [Staphylococcus microti]|uniref:Peptidase M23B n=1 Tax=Staphylococcus microti TaxID=569857 RepID=A0A0D6XPW2_9STAP|nr:LysM peptidoglycan-binding domain-containing protein [Staphylococcus microti]KIX90672.1 peptidase M23B [Staphylococcus microti]PNZ81767.1 LysM peptidoglycan-binding domain-containing protein [Staphylococcus microti]SUM56749.1 secretory antigen precursor SsaA [Staphylococcus microti]